MSEDESIWSVLKRSVEKSSAQKERIDEKKKLLEDHGVDIDTSHIKKSSRPSINEIQNMDASIWETLRTTENKIKEYQIYLDKIEAVYDNAISDILGPKYFPETENIIPKKGKKRIRGRLKRSEKRDRPSGNLRVKMKENKSMWDMMQNMSKEFLVREKRIKHKKELLEKHGVEFDTSHIKRPVHSAQDYGENEKKSMWERMQSMNKEFDAHKEFLDKMEAALNKAILDNLGPEFLN
jgi:hypothetical protein